jgi:hypothetical protein
MTETAPKAKIVLLGAGGVSLALLAPALVEARLDFTLVFRRADSAAHGRQLTSLRDRGYFTRSETQAPWIHRTLSRIADGRSAREIESAFTGASLILTAVGPRNLPAVRLWLEQARTKGLIAPNRGFAIFLFENLGVSATPDRRAKLAVMGEFAPFTCRTLNYSIVGAPLFEDGGFRVHAPVLQMPLILERTNSAAADVLVSKAAPQFKYADDFELDEAAKVFIQLHCLDGMNFIGAVHGYTRSNEASADSAIRAAVVQSGHAVATALRAASGSRSALLDERLAEVETILSLGIFDDQISRNCRDPARKLAAEERILGPLRLLAACGTATAGTFEIAASALLYADEVWRFSRGEPAGLRTVRRVLETADANDLCGGLELSAAWNLLEMLPLAVQAGLRDTATRLISSYQ